VKGVDLLIEAMRLVRQDHPSARLEIAGDGGHEPELRRQAEGEAVSFLGWQEDVAALHRRWHAFALPSRSEGFGLAALEAMAAGLPVVATRVGGLPELIRDGVDGCLVDPSAEAIAAALGALLSDARRRREIGIAARRSAIERFGLERVAQTVEDVYAAVLR
jgi:glycosyltransferase involved in cell wall biosynthesis